MRFLWDCIRSITFVVLAVLFSYGVSILYIEGYTLLLNLNWLLVIIILLVCSAVLFAIVLSGIVWLFLKAAEILKPIPKLTNIILIISFICVSLFVFIRVTILSGSSYFHILLWFYTNGLGTSLNSWLILVGKAIKNQKYDFFD